MRIVTPILRLAIILCLILLAISPVLAEEIKVTQRTNAGGFVLSIDGEEFVALSKAQFLALKNELDESRIRQQQAEAGLNRTQELLTRYEAMIKAMDKAAELDQTLITELKSVKDAYKSISMDYSDLSRKYSALSDAYSTMLADFNLLADEYKRLGEQYRGLVTGKVGLRLDLGAGLRGDSDLDKVKPTLLIGGGYKWIRIWGAFEESSTGVIAGVSIPLF